jgi:hypothetical protein
MRHRWRVLAEHAVFKFAAHHGVVLFTGAATCRVKPALLGEGALIQEPHRQPMHHAVDVANLGAKLFDPQPLTPGTGRVAAVFIPRQFDRLLVKMVTQLRPPLSQ